ncbi:hypothetical protein ACFSHT_16165 [Paraburkholderia silviterrae]|uniref:Uncharacterized protein n=1 Tax=Paraburkholderia silviterrae TaxID=2528715 RepID=A0A4R5M994_9BURK|nr:hypothetical protein [Paraburkholderia silviterrae]TDG23177.1 hypothetical protein EYW47_14655 [Paraburkholderia silviterrae]
MQIPLLVTRRISGKQKVRLTDAKFAYFSRAVSLTSLGRATYLHVAIERMVARRARSRVCARHLPLHEGRIGGFFIERTFGNTQLIRGLGAS